MSIPIPEAPMSRGWADIHMVKGVLYALVLTCRNKSFSATENRIGCIAKEEKIKPLWCHHKSTFFLLF